MTNPDPIAIEQGRVTTRLGDMYYQAAGAGQPLVLIHGLSGSGHWWARNVQPFAEHFRVFVVDLAGFGGSRRQPFVLDEASQFLQAWLEQMQIEPCGLIGHSMGGFVAAELAAHLPGRVDQLVLVDAAAVPIGRSLVRSAFGLVEALRYVPLDFLPVLVNDAMRAGPVTLARAIHDILRADLTADLSRIEADTLIVWGERDMLLPLEMGERLHKALPKASFVVIEGAGHNPMWDRPEPFNRAVLDFLLREDREPGRQEDGHDKSPAD